MARPKVSLRERFFKYAVVSKGCWSWLKSLDKNGYGWIYDEDFRHIKAHRASWLVHFGSIPDGMIVRHKCDTPHCTNPEHLELGTQKDNIADMNSRGRRGDWSRKHHPIVLQRRARQAAMRGEAIASIAARLRVPRTTVRRWCRQGKEKENNGS